MHVCYPFTLHHLDGFGVPIPSSDIGCQFPYIDPFSPIAMKYHKEKPKVVCYGEDWVECNLSECKVTQKILNRMKNIKCLYKDIIYLDDHHYNVAPPVTVYNDDVYTLNKSDSVKISCFGHDKYGFGLISSRWYGYKTGIRPIPPRKVPAGRENSINILIFGFDSASHNGFQRKLPKTHKFLIEMGAVILKGYNIVGDGTPDALFPILSGRTELQHPKARQTYSKNIYLDPDLFIFHTAKLDGYQTAYYEDMPWIGSFQYRYNGFKKRPADHYLRSRFVLETPRYWQGRNIRYCLGPIPHYMFMIEITKQFMNLKKKRFCFTFIADISHDDFNQISTADEDTVDFLAYLKTSGLLYDTFLIVMGDHGDRFSPMRASYQGKMEERMAFMSFLLPEKLKSERPDALRTLQANSHVLTTPFDIHTTLLDAMGLYNLSNNFTIKHSKIPRGMSLLRPIPISRTCDEAEVLPHWCVCLNAKWHNVPSSDPLYQRVIQYLTRYINKATDEMRALCAERRLAYAKWIIMTPGHAVYEASLQYNEQLDKFIISDKDVSRISAYREEPACVSATHPHLNKYCYCKN
ncbi:unnamed protein product, partial [Brenthis ino]